MFANKAMGNKAPSYIECAFWFVSSQFTFACVKHQWDHKLRLLGCGPQ